MTSSFRAFLGDGDHNFALLPAQVAELERATGIGIGVLFQRVVARAFHMRDIVDVIRLGLVGGGTAPNKAHDLVADYVTSRPLAETVPLAVAILEHLWFGVVEGDPLPDQVSPAEGSV